MKQLNEDEIAMVLETACDDIPETVSGANRRKVKGVLCGYIMSTNFTQPKMTKTDIKNTCMAACFVYNRFFDCSHGETPWDSGVIKR